MYPSDQIANTGSFVPTTNVWDVNEIYELEEIGEDLKDLLVRLYQNINLIAQVLNTKDTAYYINQEFAIGQLYFNPASGNFFDLRPGFRKVIDTGALAAGVNTIAHGISVDAQTTWFFINGAATNSTSPLGVSLPYAGTAGTDNITVTVDATNVTITNNSGYTFDRSSITLEYVKS